MQRSCEPFCSSCESKVLSCKNNQKFQFLNFFKVYKIIFKGNMDSLYVLKEITMFSDGTSVHI